MVWRLVGVSILAMAALGAEVPVAVEWSESFNLPGVSGEGVGVGLGVPYYGEHNGVVIVAGGSNFPDVPLIDGGNKRYHDEIYVLMSGSREWQVAGRLSECLAEGASATTGFGVVCIGGASEQGRSSRAFLLRWLAGEGRVEEEELPRLPAKIALGAAAAYNNLVYTVGGSGTAELESGVWVLDLAERAKGWQPLAPVPGSRERVQPQAFVQNGDQKQRMLYVVGGYTGHPDGGVVSLTDGYALALGEVGGGGEWRAVAPAVTESCAGGSGWPLIGARSVVSGDQHVLFFGGMDAAYFDENQRKMATLRGAEREAQRILYQGGIPESWSRNIVVYHTVTDRWFELGQVPFEPTIGGVVLQRSDGSILLASGETRPGVRTASCSVGNFVAAKSFHKLNWLVIGGYFIGLAVLGWWFGRREKSSDEYFKGGGRIPWWAAGISIFAATFSSITFLAIPALAYISDWSYAPKILCIVLIPPLVISCYLPFFRKLNLTSAYEYLELRFNLACRLFASLAFNLFMIARVAVVSYLPALAVAAATGANVNLCIVIVCLLTILYCTFGGIEAVIWSDVIQGGVLLGGALLILGILLAGTDGGVGGFFAIASGAEKLKVFDAAFDFSRPVIWVVLIGGFAEFVISYTSDQCIIQRYMTTKDVKAAGRSLWLNVPLAIVSVLLFFLIGSALYAYYYSNPELLAVNMPKPDSILPLFMAHSLPTGVAGLVMAGLFAATITTLAANLNSSATAWTYDFVVRLSRRKFEDVERVRIAQYITVAVGVAGMFGALALANMEMRAVYDQFLKFIGILTSGLACLFMLGIFAPRVGSVAALSGLAVNYLVCVGLDLLSLPWKPHLLLYGAIGIVTCWITAFVVSLVFPNRAG